MHVEVWRDLAQVPASAWDAVLGPGQGGLRHAFLLPCAGVLEQGTWRAFTLARRDQITAVSPGVIHHVDLAPLLPVGGDLVAAARRLAPASVSARALRTRVLELGPPCWPGAPLAVDGRGASGDEADVILRAAWREVAEHGQADALMVRDFAGAQLTPFERRLEARGFALTAERPTFIAAVGAASLDAYLAAMRAPYRRRARGYLAQDLRVTITADFAALAGPIADLCALTTARSRESRRERVDAEVVRGWARCPLARAVLLDDAAGLALAALVLEDPPVLHFIRVGFDDRRGRESGVYPRLLYELCRMAIARGLSFVDFGLTSADPKLRAGAQPCPLRVWVRHRNPVVQALLRAARPLLAPAHSTPVRHVFQQPPPAPHPHWYGAGVPAGS